MKNFNNNNHLNDEDSKERQGRGHHGRRRRRGRPSKLPNIEYNWNPLISEKILDLYDYELEVLRLIDLEGFTQEEVAQRMKPANDSISRGNINRYLQNARKKVVNALLESEKIKIRIINTQ